MYLKETSKITFYYDKSVVFNKVNQKTLYRARHLKDKEGNQLLDEYALSADEMDAFEDLLEDAIKDAFQTAVKLSIGVSSSLTIDGTIDGDPHQYGFAIVNKGGFNVNEPDRLDDGYNKFIRYSILAGWYQQVGLYDEVKYWQVEKSIIEADIVSTRLLPFRKPKLS